MQSQMESLILNKEMHCIQKPGIYMLQILMPTEISSQGDTLRFIGKGNI